MYNCQKPDFLEMVFFFFWIRQSVIVFQEIELKKKKKEREKERETKKKIDTFPELSCFGK